MPALPMALTRPCPGGNQGQNARGWCAPAWEQVNQVVVTPAGPTIYSYVHLACKFCHHPFPNPPSSWAPPQPTRWPQGGQGGGQRR
ncbi:hypothetical protein CspHIS471_0602700 [Cutaneotrichosporon sp. HIS471]|nr:hypothetical protein CspHIS471_0602700 [Cutaneotrichosporon sp. HIS471]